MADPFSIIAGTASVIDICVRTVNYIREINESASKIEQNFRSLLEEFLSLEKVNIAIRKTWISHSKTVESLLVPQWEDVGQALRSCNKSIFELGELIQATIGKDGPTVTGKIDSFKKARRKESKEKAITEVRQQVASHRDNLQVLLLLLNLSYSKTSQNSIGRSMLDVSDEVAAQGFQLQRKLDTMLSRTAFMESEMFQASVVSAKNFVSSVKLNKHFLVPRAVSSIYTGRESLLRKLKNSLSQADPSTQRRFVVYGMGGSGKTEFCCKFAQDNRNSFWGIFWIDGKSDTTIRHTFSNIAKVGGIEPNESAAKNWLATLGYPWLLIIDNVDDRNLDLEKHFPAGERGVVLVTTRLSSNRTLGTFGDKFFDLDKEKLDDSESNELLLRAADEPRRIISVQDAATRIARRLGYLPLALVQAGKAILRGMCSCTLWNYLDTYDRSWQKIRRARSLSGTRSNLTNDEVVNMKNVYSSYEIIYRGLESTPALSTQDAIDLLKLFSFLSNESLRKGVLIAAVRHPALQQRHEEELAKNTKATKSVKSWHEKVQDCLVWLGRQLDKSRPILPTVLRPESFDEERLGDALDQLESLSLISHQQEDDSYSMHPLIHTWVRERPEMSNAEQALWCHTASSTLAQSILLPPLDAVETAESLRRHLLPHIVHVQRCRESIKKKLQDNQSSRHGYFKATPSTLNRQSALEYGKFSIIYFANGYYAEAEELQLLVYGFVHQRLGPDNPLAWRMKLALSATYFELTKMNKSAELLAEVVDSSTATLGPQDPQTLKYMDILGVSRCFQGRLEESRQLHTRVIEGLTQKYGPDHEDTLFATNNLGTVLWRLFQYQRSHELHRKAYEGLRENKPIDTTSTKTWEVQELFALSHIDIPGADLRTAHRMMLEVKRIRKQRLGTEQPWTLLARCNLARIKSAMGDMVSAEALMRKTLPIARRNLGENHFGTLMGETHLAHVILRQKRYDEAEDMLLDVIKRHRYSRAARDDGEHPDRINAMRYLLSCYVEHGKVPEALDMCDQIRESISTIGGQKLGLSHPIAKWLQKTKLDLEQRKKEQDIAAEPG
ncbi:MAG: hypothetical protein M1814_000990 [Vezdaea aestivalis]|nr:MAG: hypothetical protein M1814_000990 [Vezdaea aestivalis]